MDNKEYVERFIESFSAILAMKTLDNMSNFSKGECRLLANLHFNGGSRQAKELAELAGISTARVTAILNVEEEKGYIRREPVAGDRRKVNVIITEAGELEFQKLYQETRDRIARYFEFLGKEDAEKLLWIMERTKEFAKSENSENSNA